MAEDKEFKVTATVTITATFDVLADDEEDAKFKVEDALVTGNHNVEFGVEVDDGYDVRDGGWDVVSVEEGSRWQ